MPSTVFNPISSYWILTTSCKAGHLGILISELGKLRPRVFKQLPKATWPVSGKLRLKPSVSCGVLRAEGQSQEPLRGISQHWAGHWLPVSKRNLFASESDSFCGSAAPGAHHSR